MASLACGWNPGCRKRRPGKHALPPRVLWFTLSHLHPVPLAAGKRPSSPTPAKVFPHPNCGGVSCVQEDRTSGYQLGGSRSRLCAVSFQGIDRHTDMRQPGNRELTSHLSENHACAPLCYSNPLIVPGPSCSNRPQPLQEAGNPSVNSAEVSRRTLKFRRRTEALGTTLSADDRSQMYCVGLLIGHQCLHTSSGDMPYSDRVLYTTRVPLRGGAPWCDQQECFASRRLRAPPKRQCPKSRKIGGTIIRSFSRPRIIGISYESVLYIKQTRDSQSLPTTWCHTYRH